MSEKKKITENVVSIDYDDDQKNYDEFSKFLENHTNRQKVNFASEIFNMGETYLNEIEHKDKINKKKKKNLIKYIMRKSSDKYREQYLLELSYQDILDIYNDIKERSFFRKIINFFNF